MWSNPRGNTGEAAAMRPSSLRQVLSETWWPSLKRARHAVKLDIRAGAKRACIWMESKWTPKNTVRWEGKRTLFLAFILRPRKWMWRRTISLWRLINSLEWARMSQSSKLFRTRMPWNLKGASAASMHFVNVLVPRPGRKEGPCIGKPSLQRRTEGTSCVTGQPGCESMHPLGR